MQPYLANIYTYQTFIKVVNYYCKLYGKECKHLIQQTTNSSATTQATQKQNVALTAEQVKDNKYQSASQSTVKVPSGTTEDTNQVNHSNNVNNTNRKNETNDTNKTNNVNQSADKGDQTMKRQPVVDNTKPAVQPVSSVTAKNTVKDVYNASYQTEKQQYAANQRVDQRVNQQASPVSSNSATNNQKVVVSQNNNNSQTAKAAAVQSAPVVKPQARDTQSQITFGSCNDLNQIVVDTKSALSGNLNSQVQFSNGGGIKSISQNGTQLTITTNNDIDFQKAMTVTVDGQQYTIDPTNGTAMAVVRSQAFDNKYTYNGNDLGANYTPTETTFKLWAPTAAQVSLNLYENDTDPKAKLKSWQHMNYDPNTGVWTITVKGDLKDTAYDYLVQFANGKSNETYDPYATACVAGGFRSVVLSPEEMGSNVTAGKIVDKDDPTNEVIGEIDVRDFTNDPSSGVSANLRGTYLGAVQTGTKDSKGNATGIDYLKQQGINTVQIQPMYQYDDDGDNTNSTYQYDWGYDPENYNVPEGWYSTNRNDPATRIKEAKAMIQGFHNNGIRVNMDVVYNHVANVKTNALALTVPGYYFRYGNNGQLTNASACGDDVASERNMVRNYIVHSCEYWHNVYGVDGFRFDLMGNLDVKTMKAIRAALPDCVMYGEGWNMGASIPDSDKADQANEKQMPTIGSFNGWGRTVIRGDDNGNPHGYITGQTGQQQMSQLANFIWGCQNLPNTPSNAVDGGVNYANPAQVINYTECHDNKTLYDVIRAAYPNESSDVSMRRAELGNAITILNEGVPFVQVGQGFGRSKNGDGNSYRSGDKINNIHWDTQDDRTWATAYEKALIQLRNSDPAFRMTTYGDMNSNMKWIEINNNNGVIGYELTSPQTGKKYIIAYSNNASGQQLTNVPNGNWKVLIKNCNGYLNDPQTINITNGSTNIPSLSCLVLEQDPVTNNKPATQPSGSSSTSSKPSQSGSSSKPAQGSNSQPAQGGSTSSKPSAGSSQGEPTSQPSATTQTVDVIYQDESGKEVGTYHQSATNQSLGNVDTIANAHVPAGYTLVKDVSTTNSNGAYKVVVQVKATNPTVNKTTSVHVVYMDNGKQVGTYDQSSTNESFDPKQAAMDHIPAGYKYVKIDNLTTGDKGPDANYSYTIEVAPVSSSGSSTGNSHTDSGSTSSTPTTQPSQSGSSSNPGQSGTPNKPQSGSQGGSTSGNTSSTSGSSTPSAKPSTGSSAQGGSTNSKPSAGSGSSASGSQSGSGQGDNKPDQSSGNQPAQGGTSNKPQGSSQGGSTSATPNKPSGSTSSGSGATDSSQSSSQSKPTMTAHHYTINYMSGSTVVKTFTESPSQPLTDDQIKMLINSEAPSGYTVGAITSSTKDGNETINVVVDKQASTTVEGGASSSSDTSNSSNVDHETDETGNGAEAPTGGTTATTDHVTPTTTTKPTDSVQGVTKPATSTSSTSDRSSNKSTVLTNDDQHVDLNGNSVTTQPSSRAMTTPNATGTAPMASTNDDNHVAPLTATSGHAVASSNTVKPLGGTVVKATKTNAIADNVADTLAQTGESNDDLTLGAGIAALFAAGTIVKREKKN